MDQPQPKDVPVPLLCSCVFSRAKQRRGTGTSVRKTPPFVVEDLPNLALESIIQGDFELLTLGLSGFTLWLGAAYSKSELADCRSMIADC